MRSRTSSFRSCLTSRRSRRTRLPRPRGHHSRRRPRHRSRPQQPPRLPLQRHRRGRIGRPTRRLHSSQLTPTTRKTTTSSMPTTGLRSARYRRQGSSRGWRSHRHPVSSLAAKRVFHPRRAREPHAARAHRQVRLYQNVLPGPNPHLERKLEPERWRHGGTGYKMYQDRLWPRLP